MSTTPKDPKVVYHDAEDQTQDPSRRPDIFSSRFHEFALVFIATMAVAMSSFFQGATVVTTASIAKGLHMSSAEIPWCTGSNALTSGAFLLTFGRVADLVDRRVMLTCSIATFSLFVLVSAFSPSGIFFNVFGGLIGLSSAAAVTPSTGLLGSIYRVPSKRKNLVFSIYGAGAPTGFVFGSVTAGVATQIGTWRATYVVMAILFAAVAVSCWWAVPKQQSSDESKLEFWTLIQQVDILSSLLIAGGMGMVSAALTLAPDAAQKWSTPYIIVLFVLGILCIIGFVVWQKYSKYPLMPLYIWKNKTFTLIMLVAMLGFASFNSAQFWLSLYLQQVKSLDPIMVAVQLLPQTIAGIALNLVCGLIMHAVRNEFLMIIGALSYTGAAILLTFLRPDTSYWAILFPSLLLIVVGADFEGNIANVYVVTAFPRSQQSLASGIFNTLMRLCVNLALGVSTAVYTSPADAEVWVPFQNSFYASVAFAGVSVVLALFLRIGKQGARESKEGVAAAVDSLTLTLSAEASGGVAGREPEKTEPLPVVGHVKKEDERS